MALETSAIRTGHQTPAAGEQRLARAMEASAPAAFDLDLVTQRFVASNRLADIYGFPPDRPPTFEQFVEAVHPDDLAWLTALDPPAAGGPPQVRHYRIRRADTGAIRWMTVHLQAGAPRADGRQPASITGIVEDVTELRLADHALIESEERLRLAIEAGKMAVWEVDLIAGTITNSPELNRLCGFPPDARPTFHDVRALYAPGEVERLTREGATLEAVRDQFERGLHEPRKHDNLGDRTQIQAEVSITTPAGVAKQLLLRAQYKLSAEGRPQITGLLVDISERKAAEERLKAVARELQHRVKNSLAVMQALAIQSFRGHTDIETATRSFSGRVNALAVATDLILDGGTAGADLPQVVEAITRPYRFAGADPFTIRGAQQRLSPQAASAISMALHELCTNAVKYGAISQPSGRVFITWYPGVEDELVIDWREDGGPGVLAPTRKGFGTRLLEKVVALEIGGTVDLSFQPDGLHCRIRARRFRG